MSETFERQYREDGFASQRRYPNEALIRFINSTFGSRSMAERSSCRVLELGCGSGANLWMIAKEGFDAFGLDTAPTGIELCKQMLNLWGGLQANLVVGDMRHLPYQDEMFDAIVDVVSMQHVHLEDHVHAYTEAHRCLKRGGHFFQWHVSDNSTSFKESGGIQIDECTVDDVKNPHVPLHGNGLMCFLNKKKAGTLLTESGFSNILTEVYGRTYNNGAYIEYLSITAMKE
ncbi:class I SAM-dependent methyltransferase [Candidatus Uhrbacteria bacterium]|nr:class I SAM-dependent methyltransferase [Candidatus Uhrbacteria bacterium]